MTVTKRHHGFTLMELMITVAIMGVLAAISIPAFTGYISTSRNTEGWNNLAAIKLAQEEHFLENNSYFDGGNITAIESNSKGLWKATGSDGVFNFSYAVTTSGGGYTATAKGTGVKVPTSVELEVTN